MELRDKIAEAITKAINSQSLYTANPSASKLADAVLGIPEIKEAVELREQWLDSPSGPSLKRPGEVRAWFRSVRNAQ